MIDQIEVQLTETAQPANTKQSKDKAAMLRGKWGSADGSGVWTAMRISEVLLPALPADRPLVLEIDAVPWLRPPMVQGQILRLSVNGCPLGQYRLTKRAVIRCAMQPGIVQPGKRAVLTLDTPCFVRAPLLGVEGADEARALAVFSVAVKPIGTGAAPMSVSLPLGQADAFEPVETKLDASAPGQAALGEGWYTDPDGAVWTGARISVLTLPAPPKGAAAQLRLYLAPLRVRTVVGTQRLNVVLNGFVIGQYRIAVDTCLALPVPPEAVDGETMELSLITPDSIAMAGFGAAPTQGRLGLVIDRVVVEPASAIDPEMLRDDEIDAVKPIATSDKFRTETLEELPAALEAESGMKITNLLRQFESMGDNCGFGIVQRKVGVEVLGLLRFGSSPVRGLMKGLEDEFKALNDQSEISLDYGDGVPREYLINVERYGVRWHTYVLETDAAAETVYSDNVVKLRYLRRKFYEGLGNGRKIYVIARSTPERVNLVLPLAGARFFGFNPLEPLRMAEVLPVLQAMRDVGRTTLLYVVPSKPGKPSGTVELVAPGLMRGYIETLAISDDLTVQDHAEWLRVVGNAWSVDRSANMTFRQGEA